MKEIQRLHRLAALLVDIADSVEYEADAQPFSDTGRRAIAKTACEVDQILYPFRRWLLVRQASREAPSLKSVAQKFPLYPA